MAAPPTSFRLRGHHTTDLGNRDGHLGPSDPRCEGDAGEDTHDHEGDS
jgi:hypothetical protein